MHGNPPVRIAHCKAWATVSTEFFVPMVEKRPREHLRDDKLQRDWEWTNKPPLAAASELDAKLQKLARR